MPYDVRWCVSCESERAFEVPPCEDGHGLDCLDLACVDCGHAVVLGHQGDATAVADAPALEFQAA
jgi:hypothetical protein